MSRNSRTSTNKEVARQQAQRELVALGITPDYANFYQLSDTDQLTLVARFARYNQKSRRMMWSCCGSQSLYHVDKTTVVIAAECNYVRNHQLSIEWARDVAPLSNSVTSVAPVTSVPQPKSSSVPPPQPQQPSQSKPQPQQQPFQARPPASATSGTHFPTSSLYPNLSAANATPTKATTHVKPPASKPVYNVVVEESEEEGDEPEDQPLRNKRTATQARLQRSYATVGGIPSRHNGNPF